MLDNKSLSAATWLRSSRVVILSALFVLSSLVALAWVTNPKRYLATVKNRVFVASTCGASDFASEAVRDADAPVEIALMPTDRGDGYMAACDYTLDRVVPRSRTNELLRRLPRRFVCHRLYAYSVLEHQRLSGTSWPVFTDGHQVLEGVSPQSFQLVSLELEGRELSYRPRAGTKSGTR